MFIDSVSKILFKRMKHGGIIKDILMIPPWNNIAPQYFCNEPNQFLLTERKNRVILA